MYGMGGGFNEHYHEVTKAKDLDAANRIAYDMACDNFNNYAGDHGIPSLDDIAEENDLDLYDDSEEAEQMYNEEREGWIDYWAKPYTDELAKSLEYEHYQNPFENAPDFLAEYGEYDEYGE